MTGRKRSASTECRRGSPLAGGRRLATSQAGEWAALLVLPVHQRTALHHGGPGLRQHAVPGLGSGFQHMRDVGLEHHQQPRGGDEDLGFPAAFRVQEVIRLRRKPCTTTLDRQALIL